MNSTSPGKPATRYGSWLVGVLLVLSLAATLTRCQIELQTQERTLLSQSIRGATSFRDLAEKAAHGKPHAAYLPDIENTMERLLNEYETRVAQPDPIWDAEFYIQDLSYRVDGVDPTLLQKADTLKASFQEIFYRQIQKRWKAGFERARLVSPQDSQIFRAQVLETLSRINLPVDLHKWAEDQLFDLKRHDHQVWRNLLAAMPISNRSALKFKARRIRDYLLAYPKDPEASRMAQAASVAERLAEGKPFHVFVRYFGEFREVESASDWKLSIWHNGLELITLPGSTRSMTWEQSGFDLDWHPGDSLEIRLEDFYRVNEVLARREARGPQSLSLFQTRTDLRFLQSDINAMFQDGPWVRFEIEDLSETDWDCVRLFVFSSAGWVSPMESEDWLKD